jgi:hypothetical protein
MQKRILIWGASLLMGLMTSAALGGEVDQRAEAARNEALETLCDCVRQGGEMVGGTCQRLTAQNAGTPGGGGQGFPGAAAPASHVPQPH